uniref:Snake toxin/toxin-like domain-containing protein n=1 Tax=Glossina pallidipes TaxID=7398 RepID=A0A1B0A9C7_GLOPL
MINMFILSILAIVLALIKLNTAGQSLTNAIHRTLAAQERINDLWCYDCNTMDQGDLCVDILKLNMSGLLKKCTGDDFICMVKRFSYTTSTENQTSAPKMWSLERRCTGTCESGCIVIGERTKLYACTSCCESSKCNVGKGSSSAVLYSRIETGIGTVLTLLGGLLNYFTYPKIYRIVKIFYY